MDLKTLDDTQLTLRLEEAVRREHSCLAAVLEHLMEFDDRRLYAKLGYPSLFAYCTLQLGYAENAAYRRVYAARLARKFSGLLSLLDKGKLHLEALALVGPLLTAENHEELLRRVGGMSKREVERFVAGLAPTPDKADHVQRLPRGEELAAVVAALPGPAVEGAAPGGPRDPALERVASGACGALGGPLMPGLPTAGRIESLSLSRMHVGFSCGEELVRMLERGKELLRHKHPEGRLEDVIGEMAGVFLEHKDPERRLRRAKRVDMRDRGSGAGRRIPVSIKAQVWERDGGRCVFQTPEGRRCLERGRLEFDHVIPWALGGSNHAGNVRLLCRAHNQLAGREIFGKERMRPRAKAPEGGLN